MVGVVVDRCERVRMGSDPTIPAVRRMIAAKAIEVGESSWLIGQPVASFVVSGTRTDRGR
jgi:hypothetical protein